MSDNTTSDNKEKIDNMIKASKICGDQFYKLLDTYKNTNYETNLIGKKETEDELIELATTWFNKFYLRRGMYFPARCYHPFDYIFGQIDNAIHEKSI